MSCEWDGVSVGELTEHARDHHEVLLMLLIFSHELLPALLPHSFDAYFAPGKIVGIDRGSMDGLTHVRSVFYACTLCTVSLTWWTNARTAYRSC